MGNLSGGCQCGAVRFTADGAPDRVGICHCMDCRKHHGALFHASAVYQQDRVRISGTTRDYQGRHFCPECGSSVFSTSPGEIELHLGAFDTPDTLTPTYELWVCRREQWLPRFPQTIHYEKDREDKS
ncbi:GFA family protein [Polycladidibacter hongkongensis]|uniref:GFA family protein n=1 Tax=Polycladidibacter hongkongensis TaxID=1647556 RepID=UPI0008345CA8|nr:GFA family protein [Pseudovibrio hongkongensis]